MCILIVALAQLFMGSLFINDCEKKVRPETYLVYTMI